MSGGSFGYLCYNIDDLSSRRGSVEEMADALEGYGTPAALEAAELTRHINDLLDIAQGIAESLVDVWRAVEWHTSADVDTNEVLVALAKMKDVDLEK